MYFHEKATNTSNDLVMQRQKGIRIFFVWPFLFRIWALSQMIVEKKKIPAPATTNDGTKQQKKVLTKTMSGHMFSINLAIQSIFLFCCFS